MIDEVFVKSAIRIRREYLKATNSMDVYQERAKKVADNLDNVIKELELIQQKADKKESDMMSIVGEIQKVLNNVEEEGKKLESIIDPLNKELEKLGQEEAELWRNIKNKHSNVPDEKIVEYVKNRLISEGLS
jgi:predicted  nucleic acid-binding Zn-ribbon protein